VPICICRLQKRWSLGSNVAIYNLNLDS